MRGTGSRPSRGRIAGGLLATLLGVACAAAAGAESVPESRWSAEEARNVEQVARLFEPPPGFDPASLFADDAVWWNGLPHLASNPGSTTHRGIEAIKAILYGAGADQSERGVDSYDLTTTRYEDVVVMADGDFVLRQHTMHARTHGGQDYTNVYAFVFRFDAEGKIRHLTEHWNTWHAWNLLFNKFPMEPAHPRGQAPPKEAKPR